jgi:hypothetical protein
MGYILTWNPENLSVELQKGNQWTVVKTGEDQYAYHRIYKSLGASPQLVENKMYVPASFFSQILNSSVSIEGSTVAFTYEEQKQQNPKATGVITSIHHSGKYSSIHIQGIHTEGIVLNLSDETIIQMADGSKLALDELHPGLTIQAEHSLIMTMSLPPQTPTYQITVMDAELKKSMLATAGEIVEVITSDDGNVSLRIQGAALTETSQEHIIVRVTEETEVINPKGDAIEAKPFVEGTKVIGYYGPAMTRSLPPIGQALKIVITDSEN